MHELKSRQPARELSEVARDAGGADALVLWLRPEDLKALPAGVTLPKSVFVSGLMGGLENAPLPAHPDGHVSRLVDPGRGRRHHARQFRARLPTRARGSRAQPSHHQRLLSAAGTCAGTAVRLKGAYLVRFPEPAGTRVVPEGDWIVP